MKKFFLPGLFLFVLTIYFLTSAGNTPYNYFVLLAQAFSEGHFWLINPAPWLNEVIPGPPGRYFVVYPPMPAILLIPFVSAFGTSFPQQYLAHVLGAGLSVISYKISRLINKGATVNIWASLLTSFGTIIWFLSATGSAWYLGQISASFFLSLAILEGLNKKRPFLVGFFLGAAYLSRLQTILSLPLLLYLIKKKINRPSYLLRFALPLAIFVTVNFVYNYLRFGVFYDKAYQLIPGIINEPWFKKGIFSLSYVPRNLKAIFWTFPKFVDHFPYLKPSWYSLAIWITTPAFVYSLLAPFKKPLVKISWLSILLISVPILTYGTVGFTQFGYRFAVDFYPILILLTLKGIGKNSLKWHHWLLLLLSISVNLWGVLWINKFGWVEF